MHLSRIANLTSVSQWRRAAVALPRWGLSAKLILLVAAVSLIGALASSFLLLTLFREQLVGSVESSAIALSDHVTASLERPLLSNDWQTVATRLDTFARETRANGVRVVDLRGNIRASSDPAEIGMHLDRGNMACRSCHPDPAGPGIQPAVVAEHQGNDALVVARPLENGSTCIACHDPSTQVLGIVISDLPIADLDAQLQQGVWRVGLVAVLTFALLVGLMVPILRKYVTTPVGELSRAAAEIGASNYDYQVQVAGGDELGDLARAFEEMRRQVKASRSAMEERNQDLSVLYKVALSTGHLVQSDQILGNALDIVMEEYKLAAGCLYLWNAAEERFDRKACRGLDERQLELIELKRQAPGGDLTGDIANTGRVSLFRDMSASPHFQGVWDDLRGRSYVNVPLKAKDQVVGTLELVTEAGQPLTDRKVRVLDAVGNQIGVALENAELLDATQSSEHEAVALHQLGTRISSSLELDQVLDAIAQGAREVLNAHIGLVALVDPMRGELVLESIADGELDVLRGERLPLEGPLLKQTLAVGLPLAALSVKELPSAWSRLLTGAESILAVPLWRNGAVLGCVAALSQQERRFTADESRLLTRLAQQVVVAIENAQLYQQVRYLAALEERDRLARELHDNLAQALGYMNLKTTVADELLARGDVGQARNSLGELKNLTRETYTDTREAIFNLRTTVSNGADLLPTLRDYLAEYRAHYGLDVCLVVHDESLAEFDSVVTTQLSRIIQEALTNVRKHANARQAWVRFEREDKAVRITVEDDGNGFTIKNEGQHYGLQIMRERAESIGGSVDIDSAEGRGTRVILRIPLPRVS